VESTRLSSIYLALRITKLMKTKADDITLVFEIMLPSSYAPKAPVILADMKEGIKQVLIHGETRGSFILANSDIPILQSHLDALSLTGDIITQVLHFLCYFAPETNNVTKCVCDAISIC
jgi:hypothetical protein